MENVVAIFRGDPKGSLSLVTLSTDERVVRETAFLLLGEHRLRGDAILDHLASARRDVLALICDSDSDSAAQGNLGTKSDGAGDL
jgi:hypothetical protein